MGEIERIYVAWREKRGDRRKVFGLIERDGAGASFRYILTEEQMHDQGIKPLVDFPMGKEYTANVLDIFSLRLNNPERPDISRYYDFWGIPENKRGDVYYMLAHTQGLLATDNYEFLAEYNLTDGLRFVSEICGLSHTNIPTGTISIGEQLTWKREDGNEYDKHAVAIYKGALKLGYVKAIHNRVFDDKKADTLHVTVKSIEANGHLSRVFVTIEF